MEKILEKRIRVLVEIYPKQFVFMPGKSTIDEIFIVRQIVEKRIENGFVDLEKAYDRISREVMYWCLW